MILLRHGQSEFNLRIAATGKDPGIIDPGLTEFGFDQADRAARTLMLNGGVSRIVTSPYSRALQTAEIISRHLSAPVIVDPLVRERFGFVCDVGTPRSSLARSWPDYDFSRIEEIWWPSIEEPVERVAARAVLFRAEMEELGAWAQTLVVSHWGFILAMTSQSITNCQWLHCDKAAVATREVGRAP